MGYTLSVILLFHACLTFCSIHSDLRFIQRRITATLLCSAIDNFLHFSATVGAQKKKYCWELYAQNEKARGSIAENGFTLYERQIKVFNENPINTNPSEKLTIKDLPMKLSDDDILQHLVNTYPEHKFISRVMKSKDEISRYRFSKYLTGDRYVYIQAPYPCQFPKHGVIASFSCRFWHSTQDAAVNGVIPHLILLESFSVALLTETIRISGSSATPTILCVTSILVI